MKFKLALLFALPFLALTSCGVGSLSKNEAFALTELLVTTADSGDELNPINQDYITRKSVKEYSLEGIEYKEYTEIIYNKNEGFETSVSTYKIENNEEVVDLSKSTDLIYHFNTEYDPEGTGVFETIVEKYEFDPTDEKYFMTILPLEEGEHPTEYRTILAEFAKNCYVPPIVLPEKYEQMTDNCVKYPTSMTLTYYIGGINYELKASTMEKMTDMFKGQYYPKTFVVDDRRDENAIIKTTYEWNVKSFDIAGLVKDAIALPDSEYIKTSTAE